MIIHLLGPDTYRSHRRLDQLRRAFRDKFDPSGFNTVTVDGQTATAAELRTAIRTAGFFSRQRFVAIDYYVADGAACPPTTLAELLETVAKDKESIVVIRQLDEAWPKKKAAGRTTKKKSPARSQLDLPGAKVEEFPALTGAPLTQWILTETKNRGGTIGRPAAEELLMLCNNDLWRISQELDKLIAYTAGQTISAADVETLVNSPYASDIFGLTDAIGQRRTATALRLLHHELQAGTHPLALIATLAHHLRVLLTVGQAANRTPPASLAAQLGLHPFVVKKALSQTKLFAPDLLRRWHHQLVDIDYRLKTTRLDAEALLDVLLLRS